MPRRSKGAYLYLDKARKQWIIRGDGNFVRTGRAKGEFAAAEQDLAAHIAQKRQPKRSASPLISDVLLAYNRDVVPRRVTARNLRYNIGSLERFWGDKRVSDISPKTCRDYAADRTNSAAYADLRVLQAAIRHWNVEYGPLASVPTIWKPDLGQARERWLTKSEAGRLLRAARRTPHLARLILLGLRTGSRPGVIKALRWSWIDFDRGVMLRREPGARERGKKRSPPVKLGRKILAHLRRWKRLDGPNGTFVVHYNGRQIDDPHSAWDRAVELAKLPGKVTPHTLRHTRATWLMQAGADPWQAAGALGMTVRMLEQVYGHHSPDFQSDVADL